jgi:hypothetical protein
LKLVQRCLIVISLDGLAHIQTGERTIQNRNCETEPQDNKTRQLDPFLAFHLFSVHPSTTRYLITTKIREQHMEEASSGQWLDYRGAGYVPVCILVMEPPRLAATWLFHDNPGFWSFGLGAFLFFPQHPTRLSFYTTWPRLALRRISLGARLRRRDPAPTDNCDRRPKLSSGPRPSPSQPSSGLLAPPYRNGRFCR